MRCEKSRRAKRAEGILEVIPAVFHLRRRQDKPLDAGQKLGRNVAQDLIFRLQPVRPLPRVLVGGWGGGGGGGERLRQQPVIWAAGMITMLCHLGACGRGGSTTHPRL